MDISLIGTGLVQVAQDWFYWHEIGQSAFHCQSGIPLDGSFHLRAGYHIDWHRIVQLELDW